MERLIEELEILRTFDQDRMKPPEELLAMKDVNSGRGGEGIQSARRSEPEAGRGDGDHPRVKLRESRLKTIEIGGVRQQSQVEIATKLRCAV